MPTSPIQSLPQLVADLIASAPEPRPKARTRQCRLPRQAVLDALAAAAAYPATPAVVALHGGAVANAYRYPADTSAAAVAAIADEETVWVTVGSASLPARGVSPAGVVASTVATERYGLWWGRARRGAPTGEVQDVAAWVAELRDPIAVPRSRLLNAIQDLVLSREHEQAS